MTGPILDTALVLLGLVALGAVGWGIAWHLAEAEANLWDKSRAETFTVADDDAEWTMPADDESTREWLRRLPAAHRAAMARTTTHPLLAAQFRVAAFRQVLRVALDRACGTPEPDLGQPGEPGELFCPDCGCPSAVVFCGHRCCCVQDINGCVMCAREDGPCTCQEYCGVIVCMAAPAAPQLALWPHLAVTWKYETGSLRKICGVNQ